MKISERIFAFLLFAAFASEIYAAAVGDSKVADSVKFYVYTRQNPESPQPLQANVESVIRNVLNPTKPITLSIHGIADNKDSLMNILVKNAKLQMEDGNVIVVDYSEVIDNSADLAAGAAKVPAIAKAIADLVVLLHDNFNFDLQHLHAVGFSLGGQISGLLGQNILERLHHRLAHITGLDPAGVFFNASTPYDERLTADDADFVEVVHTNAGYLGFPTPCGHVDYYPNGGVHQPGCDDEQDPACSHVRAYLLITEMWLPLENQEMLVLKCPSFNSLDLKSCRWLNEKMGDLRSSGRDGVYYLETNAVEPYGKGAYQKEFL